MEVERLGLVPGRTLDSFAPHVFQLLQHCYNVQIPDALAVAKPESQYFSPGLSPSSVYQALCEPRDAELFFRLGFHDTDSWHKYDTADLEGVYNDMPRNLSYLHWLAKHGAVSCQLKSFESGRVIFTTHYIFLKISEALLSWMFPRFNNKWSLEFPLATCRAWIHELNAVALPANNADACRCKCSPGGCTPLTSLLKGTHMRSNSMFKLNDEEDRDSLEDNVAQYTAPFLEMITSFTLYLTHFWGDLDIKHHTAALRYLTYTVLRIPHYCCDPYSNPGLYSVEGSENIEDIEEIYEYELELLEVLLVKFESELIAILQDPGLGIADLIDFWKQTWVGRMEAVVGNLQGSDLTDDERRGAEEIGVVWDNMGPKPPEATGSPYDETLDYWTYELAKIEAECW
ncbi:hypothetical protein E0Z10_g7416 [Xylaria hypoxylon]|uniref:Uncharacterized protein n=1 Tax=Xylaria hypoxylon TaxID=37992 RepID=A0A4Z0YY61_9PEZI|nr:hypothetical protein E0Z10_g7416 [Xylaria hypoxylon]